MNFKISKDTQCMACGDSILDEHETMSDFVARMGRFRNITKLSTVQMYENDKTVECSEHREDTFFFHPDCIKSVIRENHFNWLKRA